MTMDRIIQIADAAYGGDNFITKYHNDPDKDHGDTLAKFMAEELEATYNFDASDEEQCIEIGRVMLTAANCLIDVGERFYHLAGGKDEY